MEKCINIFKETYYQLTPDSTSVHKQVAVVCNRQYQYCNELNQEQRSLFHTRFQVILDKIANFQPNFFERATLAAENYENGLLLNIGRFAAIGTLRGQIENYMGRPLPGMGLDGLPAADTVQILKKIYNFGFASKHQAFIKRVVKVIFRSGQLMIWPQN